MFLTILASFPCKTNEAVKMQVVLSFYFKSDYCCKFIDTEIKHIRIFSTKPDTQNNQLIGSPTGLVRTNSLEDSNLRSPGP